jgi:hypothetical protein
VVATGRILLATFLYVFFAFTVNEGNKEGEKRDLKIEKGN